MLNADVEVDRRDFTVRAAVRAADGERIALFGPSGYGRTIGRIAGPALIVTSVAPLVIAFVAERASDGYALGVAAAFAVAAFVCLMLIRK